MLLKRLVNRLIFFLQLILLLSACDSQVTSTQKTYPLHYSDAIMGTSFTVKASSLPDSITSNELKSSIKNLLDRLNAQMSTYQEDSELSQINLNHSTEWKSVSNPLFKVLKTAYKISVLSEGAFDITVGSLVNLWGFGPNPTNFKAPDNNKLEEFLTKTGYKYLRLNEDTKQIKKQFPELYLDLSAIAKGYAVDQVGLLLEKQGVTNYMVEIGGELRLKGKNIHDQSWRIAIEKPVSEQRMIQKILPLTNISLATSGDYRNYFEVNDVRFSHTIDPRTGRPITHKLASVTILSDTTMTADALATALMVLGPELGFEIAEKAKIAALFIIKSDEGFIEKSTPAFKNIIR